jgi:hypothetical protein
MELICSHCHAVIGEEQIADWCPACGGAVIERAMLAGEEPTASSQVVDHRGIVLPRRHALGGIITPQ